MSTFFNIAFNLPLSAIKIPLPEGAVVSVVVKVPEENLGSVLGSLPDKKMENLSINKATIRKGTVSEILLNALSATKGTRTRDLSALVKEAGFAKNSASSTLNALMKRKLVKTKNGLWFKAAKG